MIPLVTVLLVFAMSYYKTLNVQLQKFPEEEKNRVEFRKSIKVLIQVFCRLKIDLKTNIINKKNSQHQGRHWPHAMTS